MNEIEARGKIKYRIANEMRKYGENKEAYEDLEIALQVMKELREYRAMEERLNGISVKQVVDGFIKQVENETQEEYKQGRILTNKEAEDWNEYRELGTVEEVKMLKDFKELYDAYNLIGTIEEFRKLKYKKNVLPIATIEFSKEDMQKIVDEKVAQIELDIQEIRNNAIDEFAERMKELIYKWIEKGVIAIGCIDEIAEQMKGGATDERTGSD